jgi:4-hydroxythreonine-4-phosphate dehydrogenase
MTTNLPTLAVTTGDPAGIGPEILQKALADARVREAAKLVVIGPTQWAGGQTRSLEAVSATQKGAWGHTSFASVLEAIELAKAGRVDGIVTCPISKEHWKLAGAPADQYPGHTELLAEVFASPKSGMLFVGPHLRVMLATIHVPLMEVARVLTPQRVAAAIELAHQACIELGIKTPRVAVAGLNPHAGEGGMFGDEDDRLIAPAVAECQGKGIDVSGPWPGDTVFNAAVQSGGVIDKGTPAFDIVVAMYHDQGLIPVKLIDGMRAINVTAGLRWKGRRIIRTSPAHGTAFDIAGRGMADATSLIEAIVLAGRLVNGARADEAP